MGHEGGIVNRQNRRAGQKPVQAEATTKRLWEREQMTESNADHEREAEWSEQMVEGSLRRLAANLIRITRGSGTLYEVEPQIMELAELLAKHRSLTSNGMSPHVFDKALSYDPDIADDDEGTAKFQRARSQIVRGALQLAASAMLDNNTTKHQGEMELLEGQVMWEELRKKD